MGHLVVFLLENLDFLPISPTGTIPNETIFLGSASNCIWFGP